MPRKDYHGSTNDRERSEKRLIAAVGEVIRSKGYTALTASNIARTAGLSRRLISTYFTSTEQLIETYVRSQDYWVNAAGNAGKLLQENEGHDTRHILETLLHNQMEYFWKHDEMQKIVLWQISQRTQIMYEVCEERERLGDYFFTLSDKELGKTDVDLRAVAGLLVAGIYYMILHCKMSDSLFCQIDLNKPEGFARVKRAISSILKNTYKEAGDDKAVKDS
ncbi:MAG: TetR/AcrR family transcriptional regulator [Mucilaginibacter polytrichastri]|nr:TetR/AcrR family transcriptional regulator [Mucilaginibacter polytrichastri]